ncbi:MAG: PorT family protein [Bacteroidetes bacterium]|nr:PorT family protein [Bacteroidota bacterium]
MKNPGILILLALIFCFQNTTAQQHKFEVGVEGGAGITSMWGNALVTKYNDPMIGFAYGATFQYNFPKIFSIKTNLFYERKGCVTRGTFLEPSGFTSGIFISRSNFDYLTMPVLLRANFGKKLKFFINTGPYFGYLIRQTYSFKGVNFPKTTSDNTTYFKNLDVGLTMGAGISIPLTKELVLSWEVRNNLGLYNISKWPVYNNGTLNTYSNNFLLGIAYKLGARAEASK